MLNIYCYVGIYVAYVLSFYT